MPNFLKPIKVNVINLKGNRSSTTLNYTLCETYHRLTVDYDFRVKLLNTDEGVKDYLKSISDAAQNYTNNFYSVCSKHLGFEGITQFQIEQNIMEEIIRITINRSLDG